MQRREAIRLLNDKKEKKRLKALKTLIKTEKDDSSAPDFSDFYANNCIRTNYSFSPYSPTMAVYMAYRSGVLGVGLCDHDTLKGAREFVKAANILGLESSLGFRHKVLVSGEFSDKILNNCYQKGVCYLSVKGIPAYSVAQFDEILEKSRKLRLICLKKMTEKLSERMKKHGITISFERDVKPLTNYKDGGSITERHILYAFAKKLTAKFKRGDEIIEFIEQVLKIKLDENAKALLNDKDNEFYEYDLVTLIKSELTFFYIPLVKELDNIKDFVKTAHELGGLVFYSYVGDKSDDNSDGANSEDEIITKLIPSLKEIGIDGVEIVVEKISEKQRAIMDKLISDNELIALPSAEIHSPRQKFTGKVLLLPENARLLTNCWAVIGHEKSTSYSIEDGFYSEKTLAKNLSFDERTKLYAEIGKMRLRK